MTDFAFHAALAAETRADAARFVRATIVQLRDLRRAIDAADDAGNPSAPIRAQLHAVTGTLRKVWAAYRKAARTAFYWARENRTHNNPAMLAKSILENCGQSVDLRAIGEAVQYCEHREGGA